MPDLAAPKSSATNALKKLTNSLTSVSQRSALGNALMQGSDGAVWDRTLPAQVFDWLNALTADQLPNGRYVLQPDQVGLCIERLFAEARIAPAPALTWLCDDAEALANHVSTVLEAPQLRLRLDAIYDDACRKFHVDTVVARLICTYRGPGTQVNLEHDLESDFLPIETGQPVLLKGKLWPQTEPIQLRHRSPPISGSGLARLVLVLEACSPEDILPNYDRIFTD